MCIWKRYADAEDCDELGGCEVDESDGDGDGIAADVDSRNATTQHWEVTIRLHRGMPAGGRCSTHFYRTGSGSVLAMS